MEGGLMSKLVLALTLLGISILLVFGLVDPNNPVMWLASTSANFTLLRLALIATLIALLVTNPPRNLYLRAFVGAFSLTLALWSISATYQNQMKFLDSMAILQVSIVSALAVLERRIEEVEVFVRPKKRAKAATAKA
jgi:hypothetical protein